MPSENKITSKASNQKNNKIRVICVIIAIRESRAKLAYAIAERSNNLVKKSVGDKKTSEASPSVDC
jgi:hypothetical protein